MAEQPYTGLTASVKIGGHPTGTTLAYISGVTLDLEKEIIEILAFGMTYKEKVPAIKDWSMSVDGTAAFTATESQDVLYDAFESGEAMTFTIYLNDTTYFEGTGFVSSLSIEAAPDDKINISAEVAGSGGVVFSLDGSADILTLTMAEGSVSGTQVASVSPTLSETGYMYRINAMLPAVGANLTSTPWRSYTLTDDIDCAAGDIVTLAEVDASNVVVKRGQGTAVLS